MRYGFLDESGDVEFTAGATGNFIVVVVVVGHPERLRKAVTKTRKALSKRRRNIPELKASGGDLRLTKRLLTNAVKIGFDAVAVVVDKGQILPPADPEDLYLDTCARVAREALRRFGPLALTLDKRYKTERQRRWLDRAIQAGAEDLDTPLSIQHVESHKEQVLQVADAVAWALFQKHERGDERLWQVIQGNVNEVRM